MHIAAAPTSPASSPARHFGAYRGAFVLLDASTGRTLVRYNPPQCAKRLPPCSTFKIPNSLIGLETGVLTGPEHRMKWDGVKRPVAAWNRDQTLRTAFDKSAAWYYQRLAREVAEERMRAWVRRVGYGNNDTSGPVDRFWLGHPLAISADEQAAFILRLYRNTLPFSPRSLNIVKDLMIRDRRGDAVLRGKTGTLGSWERHTTELGWFVGYVTRREKAYVFATNITGGRNPDGLKARGITEAILRERGLWL
jgi:beta-lactamase class D